MTADTPAPERIRELIEAMEAGDESWVHLPRLPELHTDLLWKAWSGSLDAAKALHDALLPGWMPDMQKLTDGNWLVQMWPPQGNCEIGAENHEPARAWLLAILRALSTGGGE